MKKFAKILSLIALAFVFSFSLVSCGSSSFYDHYKDAGADIEKDNCFEVIKVNEAKSMIANKESFIVFLGTYESSDCAEGVEQIQKEVDDIDYEGTILYIEITSIMESSSKQSETAKILGIKESSLNTQTLICLMYKNGTLIVNSNDDTLSGDNSAKFIVGSRFSFKAVVDFIAETEEYQRNVD